MLPVDQPVSCVTTGMPIAIMQMNTCRQQPPHMPQMIKEIARVHSCAGPPACVGFAPSGFGSCLRRHGAHTAAKTATTPSSVKKSEAPSLSGNHHKEQRRAADDADLGVPARPPRPHALRLFADPVDRTVDELHAGRRRCRHQAEAARTSARPARARRRPRCSARCARGRRVRRPRGSAPAARASSTPSAPSLRRRIRRG